MSNPEDVLEFTDSDDDILGDENIKHPYSIQRTPRYRSYLPRNTTTSSPNIPDHNNTKYQRLKELSNIPGFIVNVHDSTNFDIDLNIPTHLLQRYTNVISHKYIYQDISDDLFQSGGEIPSDPKEGIAYRCRLRGIGIKYNEEWNSNQICVDIKQLIDRTDGWVSCTLCDIDVYQRLLLDIFIHTSTGIINLHDYLLEKKFPDNKPIFFQYCTKRDRQSRSSDIY